MMSTTPTWERRWRRALLDSLIPGGESLPPMAEQELGPFWDRFERRAPEHLRLGLRIATWALGALPLLMGYGAPLADLPPQERDAVLTRAARLPLLADLIEAARIVACFAYFDQPDIQRAVRATPARPTTARPRDTPAPQQER